MARSRSARGWASDAPADPSARGPILAGVACLALLVGGFGAWSLKAEIASAVIAPGRIEVTHNHQIVQHPHGGIVAEILVGEGDVVAEGQLLMRLDAATLRSEMAIVEGQFLEVLARRGRYEAEEKDVDSLAFPDVLLSEASPVAASLMEGSRQLWLVRRQTAGQEVDQLVRRQEQIAEQVQGVAAQEQAVATQIGIVTRELEAQRDLLGRGLAAMARVLELEREEAGLRGRAGELAASRAEAMSRITEIEIEILRLRSARQEEASSMLRDLHVQEIELSERLSELRVRLDRLDVRAPVEGMVYGLNVVTPRSVVRAGDPLLHLVPQERPLVVAAQVATIDVNEVHVGQGVSLRFPGLDPLDAPEFQGRVEQVSADSYAVEGGAGMFYRVVITLGGTDSRDGIDLIPGMPVEAYIATGSRSPVAYLMAPLTAFFQRSFREG